MARFKRRKLFRRGQTFGKRGRRTFRAPRGTYRLAKRAYKGVKRLQRGIETKVVDIGSAGMLALTQGPSNARWRIMAPIQMSQGTAQGQRAGQQILAKSLLLTFTITMNALYDEMTMRLHCWVLWYPSWRNQDTATWDPEGTYGPWRTLAQNGYAYNIQRKHETRKDFRVIKHWQWTMQQLAPFWGANIGVGPIYPPVIKKTAKIRLRNKVITFSSNLGTEQDIERNCLLVVWMWAKPTTNSVTLAPSTNFYSRFYYQDF